MAQGEFSVFQFLADGICEKVRDHVGGREAVEAAYHYTHNVAALALGITERVIIVDGDDYCCFEWKRGEGITFPPGEEFEAPRKEDAAREDGRAPDNPGENPI
jgi:hypothetical protein